MIVELFCNFQQGVWSFGPVCSGKVVYEKTPLVAHECVELRLGTGNRAGATEDAARIAVPSGGLALTCLRLAPNIGAT